MTQKQNYHIFTLSLIFLLGISLVTSSGLAFAEIETNKSVYLKGEIVRISGTINLQDNEKINIAEIEISNANDDNAIVNEYVPISDGNTFFNSYETATWEVGKYEVTINYNDIEETTEFEISNSSSSSSSDDNDDNNNEDDTDGNVVDESNNNTSQQQESSNAPRSPTNLTAYVISSTQIDLSWSAPDDFSVTGYKIEHRTNTDPNYSVTVENTDSTDTIYSHTNLIPDTVYAYRVSAINLAGGSDPSSSTTVKTPADGGSSNTSVSDTSIDDTDIPTDVVAKAVSSTSVELNWNPPTQTYGQTIQGYTIKQEIASDVHTEIASTSGSSTKYTISNLNPDQTYTFVVVANYALGSSDASEDAIVTLTSSSSNDDEFQESNDDEFQESNDDEFQESNDDEFQESNDDESTSTQNNEEDESDESHTTSSSTTSPPIELTATPISQSRIDLSWSAPIDIGASALLGYKIESKISDEPDYSVLVTNTGNTSTTTYSHTGLTAGLTYQYRVYAITSSGQSSSSDVAEATIILNDDQQVDAQQSSSVLQPIKVTLNTDKNVYNSDDSIEISGIITGSIQNVPLGMKILSSDGTIVYVRSVPVNNDNIFEITISPAQRQSSAWQSNGEFTVEATYNGRIQATATFENNNENSDTTIEDGNSSSANSSDIESNTRQQQSISSLDESITASSNNEELDNIKNQNIALQSDNRQLRDENNQLKTQIEELNKRIEQLDAIIKEQIRVMMETLGALKSGN